MLGQICQSLFGGEKKGTGYFSHCLYRSPLREKNGDILNFAARGGPLTFQRADAITPGRVAATCLNAMIAPGNMS
jgi:hypothetical protein